MDSWTGFIFCVIFYQVIGAPAPANEGYSGVPDDIKCNDGNCHCENVTNQVYDYKLQKCANIVGSKCNISVIDFETKSPESSVLFTANCISNAECSKESHTCQCIDGYEETETFKCDKVEISVTTNNYIADAEVEISNILYGKLCDNETVCDSTEKLVCTTLSENSSSSICVCQDSTYVYLAGQGCVLPYGMKLSELLIIKDTMRRFRKQRELRLSNFTSSEDLTDRQGIIETKPSNSEGSSAKYQILDRNQYQPQNLFGQPPQNFQNSNAFQNFGQPSSQEITSGNNFQNQNSNANNFQNQNSNTNNFQNQNPNGNNFQNPNANNFQNLNPNANANNIQNGQPSVNQQTQNANNGPLQLQGNQNANGLSPQFPNPSSNQWQQPFQPVGQYQQPQISLLSLLFRPLTQLLNPQPNFGNQPRVSIFPFKREARGILAFFARIINTLLPVLRTLDYQLSPIITEIGNFRYYDNANSNGYNNQQNSNYQQNTQGYAMPQTNNPYAGNSFQPAG